MHSAARPQGITLLELLIILAVVFVIIFIAIPTLKPSEEEAVIERAKEHLLYLYSREQKYFTLHGEYAPFAELAADPEVGASFDKRFNNNQPLVDGIVFTGPTAKSKIFDVVAKLPNGTTYRVDQSGVIKAMQTVP
jgi:Tfp pilus assembly protein PilE